MEDNMNKRIANIVVLALLVAGTWGGVIAQTKEEPPDRAVVPLTDPSKPAKIEVSIMRGSITIKGYQGREVVVEARVREKALSNYSTGAYAEGPWAVLAPPVPPATAPATMLSRPPGWPARLPIPIGK